MVHVDGVPVAVSIIPSRAAWGGAGKGAAAAEGPQRVTSPMPGKIVKVLVKPGDKVERTSGAGRRRSDEDGKRAPGARRGHRHRSSGDGGLSVEAGAILVVTRVKFKSLFAIFQHPLTKRTRRIVRAHRGDVRLRRGRGVS